MARAGTGADGFRSPASQSSAPTAQTERAILLGGRTGAGHYNVFTQCICVGINTPHWVPSLGRLDFGRGGRPKWSTAARELHPRGRWPASVVRAICNPSDAVIGTSNDERPAAPARRSMVPASPGSIYLDYIKCLSGTATPRGHEKACWISLLFPRSTGTASGNCFCPRCPLSARRPS